VYGFCLDFPIESRYCFDDQSSLLLDWEETDNDDNAIEGGNSGGRSRGCGGMQQEGQ
jgi:hypothetical protein